MNRCHFDPSPQPPPVPTSTATVTTATSTAPTTTVPIIIPTAIDTHNNNNTACTAATAIPTEVDNAPTSIPMLHHTHIDGGTIDADNNGRALGIFRLVY